MATGLGNEVTGNIARHLASTLRLVGNGKLILAVLTLTLAFTGYNTPKPVNTSLFLIGLNLLVLGWLCRAVAQSFGLATGDVLTPAMAEALEKANRLFGYYLVLIGLAVIGVGIDTAMFLVKILGR